MANNLGKGIKAITPSGSLHVRDWVKQNYPEEFQLDQIKYPMTFQELYDSWKGGDDDDFYEIASQDGKGFDSDVREEIFNGFVENLGGEYDDYYYKWLGKQNPNSLYNKLKKPATPEYQSKFKAKYPDRYEKVRKINKGYNITDEDIDNFAKAIGVDLD